jgi:hypothetical protein
MTRSVTDATCLFTTVKCFDIVCPYQVEDRIIRENQDRVTKHTLGVILIQLEIFRILPVGPIILLEETSSRETHNSSGVVVDITGFHNIIKSFTAKCGTIIRKVQSIIQLVVCELGEILFAHDW